MFSYIVAKEGRIVGAWQTEWDSYSETDGCETIRITEKEYKDMQGRLEEYTTEKGKVKRRSPDEIGEINRRWREWRKNNTVDGLREQLDESRKK